ncbi:HET-domain-containing protein [Polychaeton citri CBS 116435]|uniref:HET-domain-containing protein n=1 Tax=Polychaeton citri CBS 116435 TaxID=1314669 RepID=A0A9P4QIH9_9PEZI|nr:HET-domain-containing protein [Polychaeton citri CBS 116435]
MQRGIDAGRFVKSHYYDYTPLARDHEQLRLLRIQRSSSITDAIVCSVDTYELDNCPPFAAVSYVWGSASPFRDIYINTQHTEVYYNCWVALWQIRYHGKWDYVWVDSLCIDQSDHGEKARQVRLMGSIFRKADLVISSLGDGVDFGKAAKSLRDQRQENEEVAAMPKVTGMLPKRANGLLLANASFMGQLAKTSYFDRMWVVQELVLARDVQLLCGRQTLSWDDLVETLNCWDPAYTLGNHKRIRKIIDHKVKRLSAGVIANSGTVDDLVELLLSYGDGMCTEPRDKIYSLLGLVWSEDSLSGKHLPIDYNKPIFEVLVDFVDLLGRARDIDGEFMDIDRMASAIGRLVRWFSLRWNDEEVQRFLVQRLEPTEESVPTKSTSGSSISCGVLKSCRICSYPCEGVYINTCATVASTFWATVKAAGLQFVGFDKHTLNLLCISERPALLASPDVQPGDMLLRTDLPKLGSPLLIVRPARDGYSLVGKAIQLDPSSTFWSAVCSCASELEFEEVKDHALADEVKQIALQSRDLLALALLRQRVSESLIGPVTTAPG